jgi:hypothetical protein
MHHPFFKERKRWMTKLNNETPKALVIHCSDPRFQKAFKDFIHNNLGLAEGEYIPIIVPGSIASLGSSISILLPKRQKVLLDNIKLMFERNQGTTIRLILFNHEDCRSYAEIFGKLKKYIAKLPDAIEREVSDLEFAGKVIHAAAKFFKVDCQPELYLARIGKDDEVVFDKYALE